MPKPVGSGYFAAVCGCLFFVALVVSIVVDLAALNPYVLFQAWLIFAGSLLLVWGVVRVQTGRKGDRRVGQPTINFVVAIIGATFAILAIVMESVT